MQTASCLLSLQRLSTPTRCHAVGSPLLLEPQECSTGHPRTRPHSGMAMLTAKARVLPGTAVLWKVCSTHLKLTYEAPAATDLQEQSSRSLSQLCTPYTAASL